MKLTLTITLEVGRDDDDQDTTREVSVDANLERRDDDVDDVVPRSRRAGF